MSKSLGAWKDQPWSVPHCTTGVLLLPSATNVTYRTARNRGDDTFRSLLTNCEKQQLFKGPSIFERNFLESSNDARFASLLESDFTDENLSDVETLKRDFLHNSVRSMISLEKHRSNKLTQSIITSTGTTSIGGSMGSEVVGKSLQDLIASLKSDSDSVNIGKKYA